MNQPKGPLYAKACVVLTVVGGVDRLDISGENTRTAAVANPSGNCIYN